MLIKLIIPILSIFLSQSQPTASDSCIEYNSNNSVCTRCLEGLYLQYWFCVPCNPLCTCSTGANFCEGCINLTIGGLKYLAYRDGPICKVCNNTIPHCLECNNGNLCQKCMMGKYVDSKGHCSGSCTANCQICTNETSCQLCLAGHYLNNATKKCENQICQANCTLCEKQNACKICDAGFYVSNGTCIACMSNCIFCNNSQICDVCDPSYLFFNGSCQNTGQSNCIEYTGGFASPTCLVCQPGYYNAGGSCTQCSGCLLCTQAFLCQTPCIEGYYQFNFACLPSTSSFEDKHIFWTLGIVVILLFLGLQ